MKRLIDKIIYLLPEKEKRILRKFRTRLCMFKFDQFPGTIGFEMTTKCNAECIMCARRDVDHIESKDMEYEILERVIKELVAKGKQKAFLNLTGLCEPLLYPKIVNAISYIKKEMPLAKTKIITNGIALNKNMSKNLIKNGLDIISISLNAGSRESYFWLTGVDKYTEVVKNINNLIELRKQLDSLTPAIHIDIKITDRTRNELERVLKHWKSKLRLSDYVGTHTILNNYRESIDIMAIDSNYLPIKDRWPCLMLWGGIKIHIDGNIYPCDGKVMHPNLRNKSELLLGNIFEQTIQESYSWHAMSKLRKLHLSGEYEKLATCNTCEAYRWYPNVWVKNPFSKCIRRTWI